MASLVNSTVTGQISISQAATQAAQAVRLQEFTAALANCLQIGSGILPSNVLGLLSYINASVEDLLVSSESISVTVNSGVPSIMMSLIPAPGGYLTVNSQGVSVQTGSGGLQLADQLPSGLPILPVFLHSTGTVSVGAFDGLPIPANFQAPPPVEDVWFYVNAVPSGGILTTASGVQADFGYGFNQVARGSDVQSILEEMASEFDLVVASTGSISLQLQSSPGFPQGTAFTSLFERAGQLENGGFLGGNYFYNFEAQLNSVTLTCLAPQVQTVLDLVVNGSMTGQSVVVPSGVANSEISITQGLSYTVGAGSNVRWQCVSGGGIIDAPSQLDLVMYATALSAPLVGDQLSASLILQPGGALQVTPSGVGVIFGTTAGTVASGASIGYVLSLVHPALSVQQTQSVQLTLDPSTQNLAASVNLDPSPSAGYGQIVSDVNGLVAVLGATYNTSAAGNHTHAIATASGSGFMSAAMVQQLDALADGTGQVAAYYREGQCPSGVYLGGAARWPQAMQVTGANISCIAPQSYAQVFTLFVGGYAQAGVSLVVPSGLPGVEEFAAIDALNCAPIAGGLFVPMTISGSWSLYARWQCTSGSGPGSLATFSTIEMNVIPI